jgi:hypothetical protein
MTISLTISKWNSSRIDMHIQAIVDQLFRVSYESPRMTWFIMSTRRDGQYVWYWLLNKTHL